ncbi:VWA domain-containing protein [Thermoflavimicrobium dichotomicum]|uniref:VWA domain containing CoxE-like protein n=1 Tax=Thermoflavimicrobium dichotomicum TaxID=46223 RepID=A0A1I3M0F4_9BACL|nr:VWA domain-containing protein [Thermoflavimicrobium dichotomicum]SFI90215.1 VWA domain containing CoxE-like protein [Thermoflavimicrobium dichotomicum]
MDYREDPLRWRLILGKEIEQQPLFADMKPLEGAWAGMDQSLEFLYGENQSRRGGTGASSPYVAQWLKDIRTYFPTDTVSYLQKEAIEKKGLRQLLLEPETLEKLERNVELAATLIELKHLIPDQTKATARLVIQDTVANLRKKLEQKVAQTVIGAVSRESTPYIKTKQIDFAKTVRHNIKNYQPELNTFIPEKIYFYEQQNKLNDWNVIVCVDQSGSMGTSVVYSSIMGSIFASLNLFQTHLVFFDTEIADMTEYLTDPIDILFGIQLGGGTDINRAVQYCQGLITQPDKTIFILITDLYEGGNQNELLARLAKMREDQVKTLCLLALNDQGRASYDRVLAQEVANLGIPAFACTPNKLIDWVEKIFVGEAK